MLGSSHAASGALAWTVAAGVVAPGFGVHVTPAVLAVGLGATAGAALLPDADHPEGTIAFSLGAPAKAACRWINRVSGGHRHATHSLAFVPAIGLMVWGLDAFVPDAPCIVLSLLLVWAFRALHLIHRHLTIPVAVAVTVAAGVTHVPLGWLPIAVALGVLVHLGGDCLTIEGCPLLWPLVPMSQHVRMPLLGHAGSRRELWAATPLMTIATAALLWAGAH